MRKRGWQESTTSPDWIDLETMMRALQGLHSAHVAVIVSPAGIGFGTGVEVVASAVFERLPGSSLPESVQVKTEWPNNDSATLQGAAYKLLFELDYAISRVYAQESLWQ